MKNIFEFHPGIINGWIFLVIFLLVNIIFILQFPKHFSKRLFELPPFQTKLQFIISVFYALSLNSTMLYSIFVSIKTNGIGIWIGSSIFAISIVLFSIALINYATTNPNMPVTKGIYKLTRNPQQVFAGLMWIGAGIAMQSYIIIISFSIQFVLLYPSLLAQEKFCINKYGNQYKHYMKSTPRYLFI